MMTSLSPATIGDESPSGTGTFHLTFFSAPTSIGGFSSVAMPDPLGPRNRGQGAELSAPRTGQLMTNASNTAIQLPMQLSSYVVLPRRPPSHQSIARGPGKVEGSYALKFRTRVASGIPVLCLYPLASGSRVLACQACDRGPY